MRSPPTSHALTLEFTAMLLYQDAVRTSPTFVTTDQVNNISIQAPAPRWTELGTEVRQTYRRAVLQMIEEHKAL